MLGSVCFLLEGCKFGDALRWALRDIARKCCGSVYFCGPISARAPRGEGVQRAAIRTSHPPQPALQQ